MTDKIRNMLMFITLLLHIVSSELIGLKLRLISKNSISKPQIYSYLTKISENNTISSSKIWSTTTPFSNSGDLFMAQLGIGEPNQYVYLTLDTATSPITWTKCRKRHYDPRKSRTYKKIPHDSPICKNSPIFKGKNRECIYNITYPNKGSAFGTISNENFVFLTVKNTITHINNLTFGCTTDSSNIKNTSGFLAMNKSPESLITQIAAIIGGRFSYCLFPNPKSQGYLRFGNDIVEGQGKVQTVPLVHHLYYPHAYALELIDISLGNLRLKINHKDAFASTKRSTGFIIDTSKIISQIHRATYDRIRKVLAYRFDKFRLKKKSSVQKFDLCYEMLPKLKMEDVLVSMTFHFGGGADLKVAREKVFLLKKSSFCLGLVPTDGPTVVGAMQQHDTRFTYDVKKGTVSFSPEDCVVSERSSA